MGAEEKARVCAVLQVKCGCRVVLTGQEKLEQHGLPSTLLFLLWSTDQWHQSHAVMETASDRPGLHVQLCHSPTRGPYTKSLN